MKRYERMFFSTPAKEKQSGVGLDEWFLEEANARAKSPPPHLG